MATLHHHFTRTKPIVGVLSTTIFMAAQGVYALESASTILRQNLERGVLGSVQAQPRAADVAININGAPVPPGSIVLVQPGDVVKLECLSNLSAAIPSDSTGPLIRGTLLHTRYVEVLWQGEPDDIFTPLGDATVTWSAGTVTGKLSYVTATVADVVLSREPGAPGPAPKAPLSEGKAGVLLLAGAAFDRAGDGTFLGQNIGIYPNEKAADAPEVVKKNQALYAPPLTLFPLTERSAAARVTPRFTLGELAPPVFPEDASRAVRYIAISPRLLQFLRRFEERVSKGGLDPANLAVLRGFVSPIDRQRLDQRGVHLAEFTRFQYGDAAALVYDPKRPAGGAPYMGDVDGDGIVSDADTEKLAAIAKDVMDELKIYGAVGVVSKYEGPGPSTMSPYLHVDLRGWHLEFRE